MAKNTSHSPAQQPPAAQEWQGSTPRVLDRVRRQVAKASIALSVGGTVAPPAEAFAHELRPDPPIGRQVHNASPDKSGLMLPDGYQKVKVRHRDDPWRSGTHHGDTHTRNKRHGGKLFPKIRIKPGRIEFPTVQSIDSPAKETLPEQPLTDLHPETLTVKPEAAQWLRQNVVRIWPSRCSGLLVRDPKTNAVTGWEFSTHCGNLAQNGNRKRDADGKPIISLSEPMAAYTGLTEDKMTLVGYGDQMATSADDDLSSDQTYVSLPGFDIQKDILANANQMTPEEIAQLKKGDIIYGGGWPTDQSGNKGPLAMQMFPMVFMGVETWTITDGEQIQVVVTAVPKNADNAGCTPGFSGTVAVSGNFTAGGPPPRTLGTAAGYISFDPKISPYGAESAQWSKDDAARRFNTNMDGFSGLCAFSIKQPTAENGAIFPKIVVETSPEQAFIQKAVAEFLDPKTQHRAFMKDSTVTITVGGGVITRESPAYTYDPATNSLMLISYYGNSNNRLLFDTISGANIADIRVYRQDEDKEPTLAVAEGDLNFNDSAGEFVVGDEHFGHLPEVNKPPTGSLADYLAIQDGKVIFIPVTAKQSTAARSHHSLKIKR